MIRQAYKLNYHVVESCDDCIRKLLANSPLANWATLFATGLDLKAPGVNNVMNAGSRKGSSRFSGEGVARTVSVSFPAAHVSGEAGNETRISGLYV